MYNIELIEILYRYKIRRDQIVPKIEGWFKDLLNDFDVDLQDVIPCFYKDTWGSCRLWQLILFENNEPVFKKYSDKVEWYDHSSRNNYHVLAVVPLDVVAEKELTIFMREQPSCNRSKWWSLKAKIIIHKLPAETTITERPRIYVQ